MSPGCTGWRVRSLVLELHYSAKWDFHGDERPSEQMSRHHQPPPPPLWSFGKSQQCPTLLDASSSTTLWVWKSAIVVLQGYKSVTNIDVINIFTIKKVYIFSNYFVLSIDLYISLAVATSYYVIIIYIRETLIKHQLMVQVLFWK